MHYSVVLRKRESDWIGAREVENPSEAGASDDAGTVVTTRLVTLERVALTLYFNLDVDSLRRAGENKTMRVQLCV